MPQEIRIASYKRWENLLAQLIWVDKWSYIGRFAASLHYILDFNQLIHKHLNVLRGMQQSMQIHHKFIPN